MTGRFAGGANSAGHRIDPAQILNMGNRIYNRNGAQRQEGGQLPAELVKAAGLDLDNLIRKADIGDEAAYLLFLTGAIRTKILL